MPNAARPAAVPTPATEARGFSLEQVVAARNLFWHNVMREMLTSLSVACLSRRTRTALPPGESGPGSPGATPPAAAPDPAEELFDGRLAVLTHAGERIPIADVHPLFACGIKRQRSLSVAVECTVFQIRTPDGQVFTLPLHEMRAFHALTPELMRRLEDMARANESESDSERMERPFGFAAFTSASRLPDPYYPSPPPPPPQGG